MAEWERFELSHACASNDLANRPLQPLEYHSADKNYLLLMAGAVGLEPTTNGFGDHYSTN